MRPLPGGATGMQSQGMLPGTVTTNEDITAALVGYVFLCLAIAAIYFMVREFKK